MIELTLTPEQARTIDLALTDVALRDPSGRLLARIPAPTEPEIIERIRRQKALNLPTYPAEKVESWFKRLEEISQHEDMDRGKVFDLLNRMRAGEEV